MFAVLLLPDFHLQAALRFRAEMIPRPVAITDADSKVLQCNEAAGSQGVQVGLHSVQALARCSALTLLPRATAAEHTLRQAVLELAAALSPDFEDTSEGCCTVDLRTLKITDWPRWCERVIAELAALELVGRVGVAPNPDLGFLAARRAAHFLVVQEPATFLTQLAIAEIDPPPYLLALLRDWGVHTLGQLTSLPRGELTGRLGPDADRLWQRASGQTERLLRLERPIEAFAETYDFEHEVETVEPLLFLLRRFLDQLTLRLDRTHRVASRLRLTLPLDAGEPYERTFTIPSPTAQAEVLFRILHTHLEALQLPAHPTGLRLSIDPVRPGHQQFQLFENALRDPNRFGETLARLAALVGGENVGMVEILDTYRPDAFQLVEPEFHRWRETGDQKTGLEIGLPLRRYRPPIPATVQLLRHQPAAILSSQISGTVVEVLGPYRASGGWWEKERWGVDEWDVEIAGKGLYRLSCDEEQRWTIEGCYDAGLR